MKIAVCIKRVPDMDVRFKIAADGTSLDETGVKFDLNDFDAWAVEAALQLKEKAGSGETRMRDMDCAGSGGSDAAGCSDSRGESADALAPLR